MSMQRDALDEYRGIKLFCEFKRFKLKKKFSFLKDLDDAF